MSRRPHVEQSEVDDCFGHPTIRWCCQEWLLRVGPRGSIAVWRTAGYGATRPPRRVSAKDRFLPPSRSFAAVYAKGSAGSRWTEAPATLQPVAARKPRAVRRMYGLIEPR